MFQDRKRKRLGGSVGVFDGPECARKDGAIEDTDPAFQPFASSENRLRSVMLLSLFFQRE